MCPRFIQFYESENTFSVAYARVVKLVDTTDLKSVEPSSVRTGSIPVPGTKNVPAESTPQTF